MRNHKVTGQEKYARFLKHKELLSSELKDIFGDLKKSLSDLYPKLDFVVFIDESENGLHPRVSITGPEDERTVRTLGWFITRLVPQMVPLVLEESRITVPKEIEDETVRRIKQWWYGHGR